MAEKNKENEFSIDQRLRTIKDTVDKMVWDHYVPPKTVKKSAEQLLDEDKATIEKILKEVQEAHETVDQMNSLLQETDKFCDDLDVEIKKAFDMYGLEVPTADELLGMKKNMESEPPSKQKEEDFGITFYEPTPAKPKPSSKRM